MDVKVLSSLGAALLLVWASPRLAGAAEVDMLQQFSQTLKTATANKSLPEDKKHLLEWKIRQLELQQKTWQHQKSTVHVQSAHGIETGNVDESESKVEYYFDK